MDDKRRMAYHGIRDRLPGLTISLGESISVPPSSLNGLVPVRHTRSKSEPAPPPFLTKLPPAVANVPKEDVRGYVHAKRVTNYLVGSTLGEGSFAKVKEALHVLVGEKVAMKVIDKKKAMQDPYVAKNFRREAKLLQMVCHPSILQLLEVIETDNSYYLITELCSGGELMKHIYKHGHLSEEETRKYMRQIVSAVDHLHKARIIHRDLKVENLLLDANMDIKLIDFGLSNEEFIQGEDGMIHCHTQCGSPAYAAPELLGHKDYGPEVDVWSIGVNMYAMLTGCLPYTVEPFNITALHAKMLENKMNPIPDHLSDSCKDLLHRLLTSNPEERIKMPELFHHPWLNEGHTLPFQPAPYPNHLTANDFNEDIIEHMVHVLKVKESEEELKQELLSNRATAATAVYHLLEARLARYNRQIPAKSTTRVRRQSKRVSQDQGYFEPDDHDDVQSIISCPTRKTASLRPTTKHVPLRTNKAGRPRPISDFITKTNESSRMHMRRRTMPPTVLEEDLAKFHIRQQQRGASHHLPQKKHSTLPRRSPRNTSPPPDPWEYDLPRPNTHLNPVRPPPSMPRNFSQPQVLNQLRHDLTKHLLPSRTAPAWHSHPTSRSSSRNPSRAGSRNPSGTNTREPSEIYISHPPSTGHLTDLEMTDELQFHEVEASYTAKYPLERAQTRSSSLGPPEDSGNVHFPTIHHSPVRKGAKTTAELHKPPHRNGLLSSSGEFEIRTEFGVEAILSEVLRVASNLNMREIEQITHNTVNCQCRGIKLQIVIHKDRKMGVCRLTFQWLAGGDHRSYTDICGQMIRGIAL